MTTHRKLSEPLTAYRIGDAQGQHPIFSAQGAFLVSGRWHLAGDRVIYASENYSTAVLEKLAYFNSTMPPNQHVIGITIPAKVTYEVFSADAVPNWHSRNKRSAQQFAHAWYLQNRSCILLVPSVIARAERNLVINENHPDFRLIKPGLEEPVHWDHRLFS